MNVQKLTVDQLKKAAAEAKKSQSGAAAGRAAIVKARKDWQGLSQGGKALAEMAKENPEV